MGKWAWTKFVWGDWVKDPALKMCEPGAQALWMQMLAIAAEHDPIGYVANRGQPISVEDLKHITGWHHYPVQNWLNQLEQKGVFSRNEDGIIFCRRMVRDAQFSEQQAKHGRRGGNPELTKTKGKKKGLNPSLKATLKATLNPGLKATLKPESRREESVGREKTQSLFSSVESKRDATPLEGYAPRNGNEPRANPEHPSKLKAANGNGRHLGHALWPSQREKISTFDDEDIPL